MIDSFRGKYRFLSNFYPSVVVLDGVEYVTIEHAFQAAKTDDQADRLIIGTAYGPAAAKRAGRMVQLRPDWEDVKVSVMLSLLRQKFDDDRLCRKLLATRDDHLVEGNTWGDTYWGVCDGHGSNMLGKLLMQVRQELREGPL